MRNVTLASALSLSLVFLALNCAGAAQGERAQAAPAPPEASNKWQGVDDTVVEKFAAEAGHPATGPWLPIEGDLELFAFLCAGLIGGFVCGYSYHKLFAATGKSPKSAQEHADV